MCPCIIVSQTNNIGQWPSPLWNLFSSTGHCVEGSATDTGSHKVIPRQALCCLHLRETRAKLPSLHAAR
ncbi:unnamed protein product [Boreogadus saida]